MSNKAKVKCPFCKKRFMWTHLCRMEDSGKKKDFGISRWFVKKYEKQT